MAIASTSSGDSNSANLDSPSFACSLPSVSCVSSKTSDVICNPWRNLVSQNRRRYKKDNFDLDLTYITDRIIAMGFPATDQERIYRNSMEATVAFLERYHANHYMVFNLRGRHSYDPSYFHNRVMSFEMNDHHPPRLELMAPFCRAVHDYLAADERNVVVVHCKAGKGRTGVMICAYLVYINFYNSPKQNMDYYSIVRTVDNKGVTIPSQRRYVYYFSHLRKRNLNYMPLRCELVGVYFERPPRLNGFLLDGAFRLRVANGDVDVYIPGPICLNDKDFDEVEQVWTQSPCSIGDDHYDAYNPKQDKNYISRRCYGWTVPSHKRVFIEGDVRIDFYAKKWFRGLKWTLKNRVKLGHAWFNTMFTCPDYCGGVYMHDDEPFIRGNDSSHQAHSAGNDATNGTVINFSNVSNTNNIFKNSRREKKNSLKCIHTQLAKQGNCNKCQESSIENDLENPPGLEDHCPLKSLTVIYPEHLGRKPPRNDIKTMLRGAQIKNVENGNSKRFMASNSRKVVPKCKTERLDCGGPMCLMRHPYEHAITFSAFEIDRALKYNKYNKHFKIYVVLRCIDSENEEEVNLAEKCVQKIYEAQTKIDQARNDEMRRKSMPSKNHDGTSDNVSSSSSNSLVTESTADQPWRNDIRLSNPNCRKYFFKQRKDSISVHPPASYRCSLMKTPFEQERSSNLKVSTITKEFDSYTLSENVGGDAAAEDFIVTQDKEWLEESSESED